MDVGKIVVVSANLGSFDKPVAHIEQSLDCDFFMVTDKEFPPRENAMTPRLQARIVKMFMWQFFPGYDFYFWVDASCALLHKDSVKWFMENLGNNDIAVFRHPHRETIQQEADYLKKRIEDKCSYITPRYGGELINEQMKEINDPKLKLYASTAFICRDTYDVRKMMKEWWQNTSRYHSVDQLSLPYVLKNSPLEVSVIKENFMKIPYLTPTRT